MPHVALIGPHGSGKGAAGHFLRRLGYTHWSVGDIRRRLRAGAPTDDLPPILVAAVRRARPDEPLALSAVRAILSAAEAVPLCAIDGIPDGAGHAGLFAAPWRVLHLRCPEDMRQHRLMLRAQQSSRLWLDGVHSARDARIDQTLAALPADIVRAVDNDADLDTLHERVRSAACVGQSCV